MAGEENRKIIYNDRNLDLSGYRILSGTLPHLEDINLTTKVDGEVSLFVKRLLLLLSNDRVKECIPTPYVFFFIETDPSSFCLSNSPLFGRC